MRTQRNFHYESRIENIKKNISESEKIKNIPIISPYLFEKTPEKPQIPLELATFSHEFPLNDPIKDFRLPISRNDVLSLTNWLDYMLENHAKTSYISQENRLEDLQLIYSSCFFEILRQVSVECNERGLLLARVWSSVAGLWQQFLREKSEIIEEIDKNHVNEMKRVHKMYENELDSLKISKKSLETELASLRATHEDLSQNCRVFKTKSKKLERDLRGVVEKFENLKKQLTETQLFNRKLELLLSSHAVSFDKDEIYQEIVRENEQKLGVSFIKNPVNAIKFEEINVEAEYDLETLVFGNKSVDTRDLLCLCEKSSEITEDLGYKVEKFTTTNDLVEFKEKQVQAKLKKLKKNLELDEKELIEQAKKYNERINIENSPFIRLIEENYREKPQFFNKIDKTLQISQENIETKSVIDEKNSEKGESLRKISEEIPENPRTFSKIPTKSSKTSKIRVQATLKPPSSRKNKEIKEVRPALFQKTARSSINTKKMPPKLKESGVSPLKLVPKVSRHESISEKSAGSEEKSSVSAHSVQQNWGARGKTSKKRELLSPQRKSLVKKPGKTAKNQEIALKVEKNFEPLIDFLKNTVFKRKNNDIVLAIEILHKFLIGNNLSTIFKENLGKVYPKIIETFNLLENQCKNLRIKVEQAEIERGGLKMQVFEEKTKNQELLRENQEKNNKINYLRNNLENINCNLSDMQAQYEKMAKSFRDVMFEEADEEENSMFINFLLIFY